jgi:DNA-binding Lrp family transcriptional regulator
VLPVSGFANSLAVQFGVSMTDYEIILIRALYGDGAQISQKTIAGMFGVSASTISKIVRKKLWAK